MPVRQISAKIFPAACTSKQQGTEMGPDDHAPIHTALTITFLVLIGPNVVNLTNWG